MQENGKKACAIGREVLFLQASFRDNNSDNIVKRTRIRDTMGHRMHNLQTTTDHRTHFHTYMQGGSLLGWDANNTTQTFHLIHMVSGIYAQTMRKGSPTT